MKLRKFMVNTKKLSAFHFYLVKSPENGPYYIKLLHLSLSLNQKMIKTIHYIYSATLYIEKSIFTSKSISPPPKKK